MALYIIYQKQGMNNITKLNETKTHHQISQPFCSFSAATIIINQQHQNVKQSGREGAYLCS